MKKTFFKTNNINRLVNAIAILNKQEPKAPKVGVIAGPVGRGKSEAIEWFYTNYDAFYVLPAADIYRPRWFLADICRAIEPTAKLKYKTEDLFSQTITLIGKHRFPILIDEAIRLFDGHCMKLLRDLYDRTHVPFLLVDTDELIGRLQEISQWWSRVLKSAVIDWAPLSPAEMLLIVREWTGLSIEPNAAGLLCNARRGDFRDLESDFVELEGACRINKTEQITSQMVEKILTKNISKQKIAQQMAPGVRITGREMKMVGTQ
jgi:hypothetical protein